METPESHNDRPLNPQTPDPIHPPLSLLGWGKENFFPLLFCLAVGAYVLTKLNVFDVLKVMCGLGLVIFIHELGHFLAAKWCGVYVKTFSIGFFKEIPGCAIKYGETVYKIGWLPLGGYVSMLGEGDTTDEGDAEEDPRSLKNKSVGQRMLIISAGVIMNLLLAVVCFHVAYTHGIEEQSPIIGWVDTGSPAWQEGLHSDTLMEQIGSVKNPSFDDIRPLVMSTSDGETVTLVVRKPNQTEPEKVVVEPVRDPEVGLFPVIGIGNGQELVLRKSSRSHIDPFQKGSPAAVAEPAFMPGDKIVASTDPATGGVTPLPKDRFTEGADRYDFFAFHNRLHDLRGKPMTVRVQRDETDEVVDIALGASYFRVMPGVRMGMGRVAAIRKNSPAAKAEPVGDKAVKAGLETHKKDVHASGDKIIAVTVPEKEGAAKPWTVFSNDPRFSLPPEIGSGDYDAKTLDPTRLPFELQQWAARQPANRAIWLTVLRNGGEGEKTITFRLQWDNSARYFREILTTPNSPMSIPELGLAYQVGAVVEFVEKQADSAAPSVGLQAGDLITELRPLTAEEAKPGEWLKVKSDQFAYFFMGFQNDPTVKGYEFKVLRGSETTPIELPLILQDDATWPAVERGLAYFPDFRTHKAEGFADAMQLGIYRVLRTARVIYMTLYKMVFGRISPLTMSGPLSIADISYKIASENIWQFILFIGMINVNLAVVNFLPIPLLDGGHMVFLIYEKIRGKPAPESVQFIALYIGLIFVISLMLFVFGMDIYRMFL